ncbi:hypothetical protein K2X40_00805 [Candidatus Babeliales bacterium]|nr:hypothetical protein [Candidatus Babeliales bacterium]
MMPKRRAFAIMELLIALSLSSFVILGLMKGYQSLMDYLERSRVMMGVNRTVCLLFNQLERDIMTAFVAQPQEEIFPEKDKDHEKNKQKKREEQEKEKAMSAEDKKKAHEKKLEKLKEYFFGTVDEDQFIQIQGKRRYLFKNLTFLTTGALQVYGEHKVRFVRVMYELVKDKENSKDGHDKYLLMRKETRDIENFKMRISDFDYEKQQKQPIQTHVVADNIKHMSVTYVTFRKPKQQKGPASKQKEEEEEVRLTKWGEEPFTKGVVPRWIEVTISFWNRTMRGEDTFEILFPILTYPTPQEKPEHEKDDKQEHADKKEPVEVDGGTVHGVNE